jgi:Zn-dependent M28 family amino/carboxypeptidase
MPSPQVQALIDRVTPTLVYSYVASLSGERPVMIGGQETTILNRYTYGEEGIQKATRWAYERFVSAGLAPDYQFWNDATNPNVIAEQPGNRRPQGITMFTAHLDNIILVIPTSPVIPGADDNASGSTAVLIAAEILSQAGCSQTLRFALFTGEEQGLLGSRAYAQQIAGENIRGVLNLDMIGWNSDEHPGMDLYARTGNEADLVLTGFFSRVSAAYHLNLIPEVIANGMRHSDHASFWDVGIPAILAIEDLQDFNPAYHTPGDLLSELDLDFLTEIIKASVGVLAHMACLPAGEVYLPIAVMNPASSR